MVEDGIFHKLTTEDENATTELLRNLCEYDDYREIVLRALGLDGFQIDFDNIVTQKQIPKKRKKPDIIIEKEKEFKIYIENKVKRKPGLRKSQTEDYLAELKKSKIKTKMVYLVPDGFIDRDKIKALKNKYKSVVSLVTWEEFIHVLEKYNKDKHSEIMDESIKYFNTVLNMIPKTDFSEGDIKIMTDFNKLRKTINPLAKEMELFSNVIDKLKEELNLSFLQKEPWLSCQEDEFGYYFCKENYFLGYSFVVLEDEDPKNKDYTLSLVLHEDGVKKAKLKDYKQYTFLSDDDSPYYFFKIDPDMFSEDNNGELLFNYCRDIIKELLSDKLIKKKKKKKK